MLSAESASGKYPVQAVQMMDRIVCEAESHFGEWGKELDAIEDLRPAMRLPWHARLRPMANDKM